MAKRAFSVDSHNKKVLSKMDKKILAQFEFEARAKLQTLADEIFNDIERTRDFTGFTGNTQRSYAIGFYFHGNLEYIDTMHDFYARKELRSKIQYREHWCANKPYEGEPRSVEGKVETDMTSGYATSIKFLTEYKPKTNFAIVVCTGTEYSQYLENVRHLNVLSITRYNSAYLFREAFSRPAKLPF